MEGEDDVVGVGFDEGVELGSVLLEWCFEKCGLGDECLLELVSCSVDFVWLWLELGGRELVKLGAEDEGALERLSVFSGSFFLFLIWSRSPSGSSISTEGSRFR